MADKELLKYRSGYLEDKKGTYRDHEGAETAVLEAARKTQESIFDEHQSQLDHSSIYAPHDGFFDSLHHVFFPRRHCQCARILDTHVRYLF